MSCLLWWWSVPSFALTSRQHGPALDLGVGLGVGAAPARPMLGIAASAGWWVGTYDDEYAFGRYWALGPTVRVDLGRGARVAPTLELRRGLELFVAGVAPFVAVGPVLTGDGVGATARIGLNGKLRRTRSVGLTVRFEGGADWVAGAPSFTGGLLLGGAWARPISGGDRPR
jgi:hypothetical protein